MGAPNIGEAERMARHNAEMKLALAENLSLAEARSRLARERYLQRTRCGTHARELPPTDKGPLPQSAAGEREDPQFWWQKL